MKKKKEKNKGKGKKHKKDEEGLIIASENLEEDGLGQETSRPETSFSAPPAKKRNILEQGDGAQSNQQNSLDRLHAFNYLVECRSLAVRLADHGMDIEVSSKKDQIILAGFEAVWLSGWLNDTALQGEAGLTPAHIATLGYLLAQQQSHRQSQPKSK